MYFEKRYQGTERDKNGKGRKEINMATILPIAEQERAMFQALYKYHTPIGWLREEGGKVSHLLVKMKPGCKGWTPYGTARDCGDHYIIARYDRYDKIDKHTHTMTKDVEDR